MTTWLDRKAAQRLSDDLEAIPRLSPDLPALNAGSKDPTTGPTTPPHTQHKVPAESPGRSYPTSPT